MVDILNHLQLPPGSSTSPWLAQIPKGVVPALTLILVVSSCTVGVAIQTSSPNGGGSGGATEPWNIVVITTIMESNTE